MTILTLLLLVGGIIIYGSEIGFPDALPLLLLNMFVVVIVGPISWYAAIGRMAKQWDDLMSLYYHDIYMDNQYGRPALSDEVQEKPVQITINGSAQPSFPKTEEFIDQIGIAFNDNVYPCIWHGDEESEKEEMALFNGFHANLDKDIANGDVSAAAGNLIPCAVLDAPQQEGDFQAWEDFVAWYNKS